MKKIIFICVFMLLLVGCSDDEPKRIPYEGNLDRIRSEIEAYESNISIEPVREKKTCRVDKYTLDLRLDVEKKQLNGTVLINMTNETTDSLEEICIRNYAVSILAEKGNAKISKVAYVNESMEKNLSLEVKEDASVVYAKLEKPFAPQEKLTLCVEFSTDIPKKDYRFGYHKDGDKQSFVLTYCFPVIAMYEEGTWCEYPYISHAESNYHTVTDYEVTFQTPKEYIVVATGKEETYDGITKISGKSIRDFAIVASNYMKVQTVQTQGIDINLYSLDYKNKEKYDEISLLTGKDSIDLLTELVGSYAYEELDIVQCFYHSAMEYPGFILVGLPDMKSPEEIDDSASFSNTCSRIFHEVAHQWFYGAVGNNQYMEAWLDESFAEYFEDFVYSYSGCESVKKAVELDVESGNESQLWGYESEEDMARLMEGKIEQLIDMNLDENGKYVINDSYDSYTEDSSYSAHVYDGGATFLYELQKKMGDGAFFHMLREYYKIGYMKEVTTEDFICVVKAFDDSKEVDAILNKYLQ